MTKFTISILLFVGSMFSSLSAQGNQDLADILATAIEANILDPYLPHDSLRQLSVGCLIVGRKTPTRIPLVVGGRDIPVLGDREEPIGFALRVKKLRWKNAKALVILRGPEHLTSRFYLTYWETRWYVTKAFVKGVATRQGKRQKSWDVQL